MVVVPASLISDGSLSNADVPTPVQWQLLRLRLQARIRPVVRFRRLTIYLSARGRRHIEEVDALLHGPKADKLAGMPPRRPTSANGNNPDKKLRRYAWDVYCTSGRSRWVGRVIATTADKAMRVAGKLVLALAMTQPADGTLDLRCATSCAAAGSGSPSVTGSTGHRGHAYCCLR
jgi:hypothetical protein